eukprot:scaffold7755_cov166-Amphora_coffeaeformis.AAC.3
MIDKVLPAIYEKFPRRRTARGESQMVYIQQDNPNTHFKHTDRQWVEACNSRCVITIGMREQPAQSPDTNVLDLGYFRALQMAAWKIKSIEQHQYTPYR